MGDSNDGMKTELAGADTSYAPHTGKDRLERTVTSPEASLLAVLAHGTSADPARERGLILAGFRGHHRESESSPARWLRLAGAPESNNACLGLDEGTSGLKGCYEHSGQDSCGERCLREYCRARRCAERRSEKTRVHSFPPGKRKVNNSVVVRTS